MVEHQFECAPEGLGATAPGPALGAALATVDPTRARVNDLPVLLAAARRQLSHEQARFAQIARELALAAPDQPDGRTDTLGEYAADEVRAVLSCSRTAAWTLVTRADDATVRLSALAPAWHAGAIDEDRVRIFCTWTEGLSDEHARQVVDVLLPEAPRLTLRALIERIRQIAIALDPDWARRLYDNTVRQRRVRARMTEQGTANLSGLDLPVDATARSVAHITAMAARAQALGHPGRIDTVRAEIFLALLSPRLADQDDRTIVEAVVAAALDATDREAGSPPHRPAPDPAQAPPDDEPREDPGEPEWEPERVRRRKGPRQARIELRVALSTLLGLDEKPARLPGWGTVHADVARQLARDHTQGEWRIAVTDSSGALTAVLLTRRRPIGYRTTPHPTPADPMFAARPVVQIQVDEDVLAELDAADHPGWVRVLVDLQHQLRLWREARDTDDATRSRNVLARFPDAALARWVEVRDQHCVFPGCGASALCSDLDHTLAFVAECGLTVAGNLDPLCGHDHGLKHDTGWRLEQPTPGTFVWTSPTGHRYPCPPPDLAPDLPPPRPPDRPSNTEPRRYADHGPVWDTDPYPAVPPTPRVPRPGTGSDAGAPDATPDTTPDTDTAGGRPPPTTGLPGHDDPPPF